MRYQKGFIWRKGDAWYGRWCQDVVENGRIIRKQQAKKLADYNDRYRSKKDVKPLLDEILAPINEGKVSPSSTLTVAEFVDGFYLPYAQENCRPSTYSAYERQFRAYLAPRLKKIVMRDFRTSDAAKLLGDIHREHRLGRTTLRHLKSFLSSVFTFAINQGILDGYNPVRLAQIPNKAAAPKETAHATPEKVLAMLDVLEKAGKKKARAAVALMFFAGLRPGEARGATWEDFDGKQLMVRRSIWQTHTTEPKTVESSKPVPIIEPLRTILTELREGDLNPASGPILRGPSGRPLHLDNMARREIRPALTAAGIPWHGWYALRRGIATLLNSVEKDPMAAKGLLRHTSVITTQKHYIKEVPATTLAAMQKIEVLCNQLAPEGEVLPA